MLDDISLYWLTDTAASSARLYYESFAKDFVRMTLDMPVAVSIFKGDLFVPPKPWGDRTYSKLFYWNEVPEGGHFPRLSNPSSSSPNCARASRRCADCGGQQRRGTRELSQGRFSHDIASRILRGRVQKGFSSIFSARIFDSSVERET